MCKKRVTDIKCVVFDLDGTLVDTSPGIIESVKYAVKEFNYPVLTQEQLLSFIGPPLKTSFIRCCGCDDSVAERLTETYRNYYRQGAILNARLYDGIIELLKELYNADIQLTVATSKPQTFAEQIIFHFGLERYLSAIRGADIYGKLTKADLISQCVKDFDLSGCIMVGDTVYDAKGAEETGISFIAVSYGFGNLKEIKACRHVGVAQTPLDLLKMLCH